MPDTHLSRYAFEGIPATAETREVARGVHWHRMPLPFKLDHINLWLLEDGDGWTAVDTGIDRPEVWTPGNACSRRGWPAGCSSG